MNRMTGLSTIDKKDLVTKHREEENLTEFGMTLAEITIEAA